MRDYRYISLANKSEADNIFARPYSYFNDGEIAGLVLLCLERPALFLKVDHRWEELQATGLLIFE